MGDHRRLPGGGDISTAWPKGSEGASQRETMRSRVLKKRAQRIDGVEISVSLAGMGRRKVVAESGEGVLSRSHRALRPPVRVHRGLSQNHLPLCLPCVLIHFSEWERVELPPACQESHRVPQSQGRASHMSASSIRCVQVRIAGFQAGGGREGGRCLEISTWSVGVWVGRELWVAVHHT